MENVSGKAFDVNRKLDEINELLKEYSSVLVVENMGIIGTA